MLLIAHRGFSQGADENTLTALERSAADPRIGGIEVDIRASPDSSDVVLRHDPFSGRRTGPAPLTLDDALRFAQKQPWQVLIECKEYNRAIYQRVCELVDAHGMADRVVLFAFRHLALGFAWRKERPFRLGLIEEYPWRIEETARALRPDVVLTGWVTPRARIAVKSWWSLFSLERLARRIPETSLVMGVAQDELDLAWLRAQRALFAATVDFPPSKTKGEATAPPARVT